jgi:hypothetical protein
LTKPIQNREITTPELCGISLQESCTMQLGSDLVTF